MDVTVSFLVVALLMVVKKASSQTVEVDLIADPANNITEAGTVLLTCKIIGTLLDNNDTVIIRKSGEVSLQLASKDGKDPGAPENIKFVGWFPVPDNADELLVSVSSISRADKGNYTCEVLRSKGINTEKILVAQDSVALDVLYAPSGEPSCNVSPVKKKLTYFNGDEVSLKCTSDAGKPTVRVQWSNSGNLSSLPKPQDKMSDELIISDLTLRLTTEFDNVIFYCKRLNNVAESCNIGPFKISTEPDTPKVTAAMENEPTVTDTWMIPVIVVVVILVVVIIAIIVYFKKCRQGKPTTKSNKSGITKDQIAIQMPSKSTGYEKIPAADESSSTDQQGASPNDSKNPTTSTPSAKPGSTSKPLQKSYPNPPSYPRPAKSFKSKDETPYANTEVKSPTPVTNPDSEYYEYPDVTSSPKTENAEKEKEEDLYEKTEIGSSVQTDNTKAKSNSDITSSSIPKTENKEEKEEAATSRDSEEV